MTNNKDVLAELGDEIPQFAPNFSVYLLQTDLVCLYSEDRKFLLHGELYGALATMIAKGGKSFQKLARELEKTYPADMIRHALTRMLERRYILPASRASRGQVAAYWASLGFSPQIAAKNLENCRVRLQSLDVEGAVELEAALKAQGVRVVKRGGDLTVTLVGDYLDARLDEVNQQRLAEGAPWALIHPAGIFPLVGPVFRPGESACWKCLSDRMRLNREVRTLLDRKGARRLTASPLAQRPFGLAGVELAAVEIAKAIGTGFRT
ncbi:MAG TPA: TOMM precursor leader peptide-binding protein, partial [Methylocystis sp.]|nr:TOMM precursor leader peptide-binding protein [Methylocystis sp.]